MKRPAALGGPKAFPDGVPFVRPALPPFDEIAALVAPSYERGILTNGDLVRAFEADAASYLGVDNAVAVSCCTAGLMLTVQALDIDGPVLLPSFTFTASAHAVVWNGLTPRFAECSPGSAQIDVDDAEARIDGAGAILATHVFGAPAPVDALEKLAATANIPLVFDAAHGFGAVIGGRAVGSFGTAEVFSLSPTKPVVAMEGGLVTTSDRSLAATLRVGRDYGNPGDYDARFAGLNARMSEVHAATAILSLRALPEHLEVRRTLAARYADALSGIPGLSLQTVDAAALPTFKDFTTFIDPERFGLDRDAVAKALKAEGIDTRPYFSPPVHRQQAYASYGPVDLPVTDAVSASALSLPFFVDLGEERVDRIAEAMTAIQRHGAELASHMITS